MELEKNLEAKCKKYAKENGFQFVKIKSETKKGLPDRMLYKDGFFCFVEMKTKRGKLSIHQESFIKELRASGQDVEVVHSYEEFTTLINAVLHTIFWDNCSIAN